jgi:hypothetical protein
MQNGLKINNKRPQNPYKQLVTKKSNLKSSEVIDLDWPGEGHKPSKTIGVTYFHLIWPQFKLWVAFPANILQLPVVLGNKWLCISFLQQLLVAYASEVIKFTSEWWNTSYAALWKQA